MFPLSKDDKETPQVNKTTEKMMKWKQSVKKYARIRMN